MAAGMHFSADDARRVGAEIGIDWDSAPFDVEQFRKGMDVELEHGLHDPATNVTGNDPVVTGKIALAHLKEFPDYYTRLERMEEQAKRKHGAAGASTADSHTVSSRARSRLQRSPAYSCAVRGAIGATPSPQVRRDGGPNP
jgi:hypothetical protein